MKKLDWLPLLFSLVPLGNARRFSIVDRVIFKSYLHRASYREERLGGTRVIKLVRGFAVVKEVALISSRKEKMESQASKETREKFRSLIYLFLFVTTTFLQISFFSWFVVARFVKED